MLRDARVVPNVSQTAADLSTVISLVGAQMGVAILAASAVKHSVASAVACDIAGDLPMSEIALVCDERVRTPVVDKLRSFALKSLGGSRNVLSGQPELTLPRTRLNLLCFDGRLVTTAASSGRRRASNAETFNRKIPKDE